MNFSTSLICCDLVNIKEDIINILKYSDHKFNWFHADFMDGNFVPRLGISPELIQSIRNQFGSEIIIDSHLMVDDPYEYADVIAPYSDYFMFHAEAVKDPIRTIQKIRKKWDKVKVGMYFNLGTSIESYFNILKEIDCIGLMGISPGVLGTWAYKDIVIDKLNFINVLNSNLNTSLEVFIDGSVNYNTIPIYKEKNAKTLVCGSSSIFKIDENTKDMLRNEMIKYNIDRINNL